MGFEINKFLLELIDSVLRRFILVVVSEAVLLVVFVEGCEYLLLIVVVLDGVGLVLFIVSSFFTSGTLLVWILLKVEVLGFAVWGVFKVPWLMMLVFWACDGGVDFLIGGGILLFSWTLLVEETTLLLLKCLGTSVVGVEVEGDSDFCFQQAGPAFLFVSSIGGELFFLIIVGRDNWASVGLITVDDDDDELDAVAVGMGSGLITGGGGGSGNIFLDKVEELLLLLFSSSKISTEVLLRFLLLTPTWTESSSSKLMTSNSYF